MYFETTRSVCSTSTSMVIFLAAIARRFASEIGSIFGGEPSFAAGTCAALSADEPPSASCRSFKSVRDLPWVSDGASRPRPE